jgi:hypothetical protein
MGHEDAGNYAGKRQGSELNERIAASIRDRVRDNGIACAEAHDIATKLKVDPAEVGTVIDLLEVRINKCQLGLFQHEKDDAAGMTDKIGPELESAIKSSLVDGRLKCADAWDISKRLGLSRRAVGTACETIKIKISVCQLGTFK